MNDEARTVGRVRALGQAAVAEGWRRKAAEQVAPRAAGSTPVSGGDAGSALGLAFLAMSGSYLVKTLLDGIRRGQTGQPPRTALLALPLAGADKGWRKSVADRVTPTVTARTPLDHEQARALLGAAFIGLSAYYVAGSVRRYLAQGQHGRQPPAAELS
jgi:hypothetical protein